MLPCGPLIQCFTLSMQQASTKRGSGWDLTITKSLIIVEIRQSDQGGQGVYRQAHENVF